MIDEKPFPRMTWEQLKEEHIAVQQYNRLRNDFIQKFFAVDVFATDAQKHELSVSFDRFMERVKTLKII